MTQITKEITLSVNGESRQTAVEPRTHLADFLREDELLTGTHLGCEQGVCGACTIFVDGRPVRSCLTLAVACDGADVRTVEGFDDDPLMAQIKDSFSIKHGLQCGFCTPGMLTTAYDIIRRYPDADDDRIRRELSGNLCRCTGYAGIVAAIRDVLDKGPQTPSVFPISRHDRHQTQNFDAPANSDEESPSPDRTNQIDVVDLSGGEALSRNIHIDAPLEAVWEIMSDLPSIAACIPGAVLDETEGNGPEFSGKFVVSVGPMKAAFSGNGKVDMKPEEFKGHVIGRGTDRVSRSSVSGELSFKLEANDAMKCLLHLDMAYDLRGPLAQFGRKALVEEIADRLLADTAANVAAQATGQAAELPTRQQLNGFSFILSVIRGLLGRLVR